MEALYRYISGAAAALTALFAPIVPLVWCLVGFIGFDFLTGIAASFVESRRARRAWRFSSREAWRTVEKLGFTIIALGMAFLLDQFILDFLDLNLTKLFAGFVCGVEMWSFLENACRISDDRLLRYLRCAVVSRIRKGVQRR